jgi:hypothetical protein
MLAPPSSSRAQSWLVPTPPAWINGNALDTTGFFRFIRSYKARFRPVWHARRPGAAADWNAIIAAPTPASTAVSASRRANRRLGRRLADQASATGPANWHQMSQFWMGMADKSGGYDAWLATTPANRAPFLVVTDDRRSPGASRGPDRGHPAAQLSDVHGLPVRSDPSGG